MTLLPPLPPAPPTDPLPPKDTPNDTRGGGTPHHARNTMCNTCWKGAHGGRGTERETATRPFQREKRRQGGRMPKEGGRARVWGIVGCVCRRCPFDPDVLVPLFDDALVLRRLLVPNISPDDAFAVVLSRATTNRTRTRDALVTEHDVLVRRKPRHLFVVIISPDYAFAVVLSRAPTHRTRTRDALVTEHDVLVRRKPRHLLVPIISPDDAFAVVLSRATTHPHRTRDALVTEHDVLVRQKPRHLSVLVRAKTCPCSELRCNARQLLCQRHRRSHQSFGCDRHIRSGCVHRLLRGESLDNNFLALAGACRVINLVLCCGCSLSEAAKTPGAR